MVSRPPRVGSGVSRVWLIAGVMTLLVVTLADIVVADRVVLLSLLVAAPLVASVGATVDETAVIALLALGVTFPLAAYDGASGTAQQVIRVSVLLIGSVAAVVFASLRERRERELSVTRAQALDAQRLRLALDAGHMGTWRWDVPAGRVEWDSSLEALFGLAPGTFDGSFDAYSLLIHEEDRARVLAAVDEGMAAGRPWGFDHRVVWSDGTVHWLEGRGEPIRDAAGTIIGASGITINVDQRHALLDAETRARARLRVLVDASEQLGALDDPERIIETIAELAATRVGTWDAFVRILPDGRLACTCVAHRDQALEPIVRAVAERMIDESTSLLEVLSSGEPALFRGLGDHGRTAAPAYDEMRTRLAQIGYESGILVPIAVAGRQLAVLSIGDGRPEPLGPADLELATDLGRRGGSALERAELWRANAERLEAEHRIVELLQRTIVPEHLPTLPGARLAAAYRTADIGIDVGGDWYDAFVGADGAVVVVVGDVAGHGIQAASLMGRVRNALRAYAVEDSEPAAILSRLHTLVRAHDPGEMVTAFVARYDPTTSTMSWSRAGHPPPLVVAADGATHWLDAVNGPPLGTLSAKYETAVEVLPSKTLVVCYTDGLIERRDRPLDDGLAWLDKHVAQYATDELETLCDKLVNDPFVPHPAPDDMCVLALRTEPV